MHLARVEGPPALSSTDEKDDEYGTNTWLLDVYRSVFVGFR